MSKPASHSFASWLLLVCFVLALVEAASAQNSVPRVRSVSLGGWLVIEKWIKPSLFDNITQPDLLDGTLVTFKSSLLGTYVTASGDSAVSADGRSASSSQTFKLWRITSTLFQFRASDNNFLTAAPDSILYANVSDPGEAETFEITRNGKLVLLKSSNGMFLRVSTDGLFLVADSVNPEWSSQDPAVFEISVDTALGGEYQLANGYGKEEAQQVFKEHRDTFITESDFEFLAKNAINNVRVPVGWWIAYDPSPPAPFVSGSLQALDNAFTWAESNGISVLVDLHAAPGSQNQWQHCGTRDGVSEWASSDKSYIQDTLKVIEFLVSRYSNRLGFFGIELLNEPTQQHVPLNTLKSYYLEGYKVVRKHSPECYVVLCQLIGASPNLLIDFMTPSEGFTNVALDVHWYNLFEDRFANTSAEWNINYVLTTRYSDVQRLNKAGGPLVFVGEWTNEWMVNGASEDDYRSYGTAQMKVFGNATLGWSYWGVKSKDLHWDFERMVDDNLLIRQTNGQWP